jgi:MoxR-like ATPase
MNNTTGNSGPAGQLHDDVLAGALAGLARLRAEVSRVVLGQDEIVEQLLTGLICGGHVLLEGAPGLGKTLLVRTVAVAAGLQFSRIQFTPDLMPADVTGTMVLLRDEQGGSRMEFQPGPIFAQLLLTDEINRATPKTQSALLEAMQEHTVTAAGRTLALPEPFFVLATQHPIEMEGTYVLPEAQVDRFLFKILIPFPSEDVLDSIFEQTTGSAAPQPRRVLGPEEVLLLQELVRAVPVASHVRRAVARFVLATHPGQPQAGREVQRFVRFGVSPRGGQSLLLAAKGRALLDGRYNVSFADLEAMLLPALRHRFQLNFEGEADGSVDAEELLKKVFAQACASVGS